MVECLKCPKCGSPLRINLTRVIHEHFFLDCQEEIFEEDYSEGTTFIVGLECECGWETKVEPKPVEEDKDVVARYAKEILKELK